MIRPLLAAVILGATACTPHIQMTSGEAYIGSTPGEVTRAIDDDIAAVAAVEPDLHFPARIGIARVVNGGLSLPPMAETALFAEVAERNSQFGEFVPVSPLVLALVSETQNDDRNRARSVIHDIRLAAARQHLDYVIVYEVGARSRTGNTPFALADVTLVGGMLLPTRKIEVAGIGAAMFLDVRNGYPYGTAQVAADLSGFARTFQSGARREELRERATLKVTEVLVPDIEKMLAELALRARQGGS